MGLGGEGLVDGDTPGLVVGATLGLLIKNSFKEVITFISLYFFDIYQKIKT
jgi:hypothetical protein